MIQLPMAHVPFTQRTWKQKGLSDCNTICRITSCWWANSSQHLSSCIFCRLLGGGQDRKPHTLPVPSRQWETILWELCKGDTKAMGDGLTVASLSSSSVPEASRSVLPGLMLVAVQTFVCMAKWIYTRSPGHHNRDISLCEQLRNEIECWVETFW